MTFEETIVLPSSPEALKLSDDVIILPEEFEPVARALFDVDIHWVPGSDLFDEYCRVLPALTYLLEKSSILPPRSNELAAAILTVNGSRRFTHQLSMKKQVRATSGTF